MDEQQFVTVLIDEQLCGVPVLAVRDVLASQAIARIPLAPPQVAGSLNLRGRIVTAIDLRRRLNLPPAPQDTWAMSVVTEHEGNLYALLVDKVAEVVGVSTASRDPNPATLSPIWAGVSDGIYRLEKALLVALNVPRILSVQPDRGGETGSSELH